MARRVLIADIGGTNSRLALAGRGGTFEELQTFRNDEVTDLASMLGAVLDRLKRRRPEACVLAVAGPVDGDHVTLTNRAWSFSQRKLRQALRLKRLLVVNDFVAVAHGVPALAEEHLVSVGGGRGMPRANVLACGPGTGFGCALLLRAGRTLQAIASEAGHMRLAAATADEARVVAHFVRDQGAVAVEDVLSGPGLARLHRLLAGEREEPEGVIRAALGGSEDARASVDVFLRLFGRIAGDLALALDARGGVYIAGGLGQALAPLFAKSPFRAAFEDHPPYQARLAGVPTRIIRHPEPGLLGAAVLAERLIGR